MVHENTAELLRQGEVPPGYEGSLSKSMGVATRNRWKNCSSRKSRKLTGSAVKSAMVARGNLGQPEIEFTLDSEGRTVSRKSLVTTRGGGWRSCWTTNSIGAADQRRIPSGSDQITGDFSDEEARQLANVLQNPLQVPVSIRSESSVNPTLGKDTIHSGIMSAIYGTPPWPGS